MNKKEKEYDIFIDEVIEWSTKKDHNKVSEWENIIKKYLSHWGWNKVAIKDFVEWGEYGFNNNLLHFETEVDDFYDEVDYASDRMSIDRLFRCHVKYRTLKE